MRITGYVTVIVPVHNGALTIRRCLEAIAAQHYRPLEVVVVDDGSSDPTPAWIRTFRGQHPDLSVHVVHQAHAGAPAALAAGLARSRGEFAAFCHQADEWHADRLSEAIARLQAAPEAGYALSGVIEKVGASDLRRKAPTFRGELLYESVPLSGLVARRDALMAIDLAALPAEAIGHALVSRLAIAAPGLSLQTHLATCHRAERDVSAIEALIATWDSLVAEGRLSRQQRDWGVGKLHAIYGWQALLADEPERARAIFKAALEATPYRPEAWLGLACARLDQVLIGLGLIKPHKEALAHAER